MASGGGAADGGEAVLVLGEEAGLRKWVRRTPDIAVGVASNARGQKDIWEKSWATGGTPGTSCSPGSRRLQAGRRCQLSGPS